MTASSYAIAPGETADSLAMRRKLALMLAQKTAQPPKIEHWAQGLAHLADSAYSGYEIGKLQRDEKAEKAKGNALMAELLGGGGAATSALPNPQPNLGPQNGSGVSTAQPSVSGKIYANDEPSPLDPPSGRDRDMAVRTILAEAGNQAPTGQAAVANVMRNRAVSGNFGGDTLPEVITKPRQFEPWNTQGGRDRMAAIDTNSPQYKQAAMLLDGAYAGEADPTKGATHFYAPKTQAALGRPAPSWDNGAGVDIGDHRFFGGAGSPAVTAGATDVSAQSRPGLSAAPVPAAAAAPATPAAGGGMNRDLLVRMLANKNTAPMAQAIIQKQLADRFAPDEFGFQVAGDQLYRTSKRKGTAEAVGTANKPTALGKDQRLVDPVTGKEIVGAKADRTEKIELGDGRTVTAIKNPDGTYRVPNVEGAQNIPPKLSEGERDEIIKADDALLAGRSVLDAISEAKKLNSKAFSGAFAEERAWLARNTGIAKEGGQATTQMNTLVSEQALNSLKATFGGNPTEGERKILLDLQASVSKSPEERAAILDRAAKAAERRIALQDTRGKAIRSGQYYRPDFNPGLSNFSAPGANTAAASDPLGIR